MKISKPFNTKQKSIVLGVFDNDSDLQLNARKFYNAQVRSANMKQDYQFLIVVPGVPAT